ncbi:MAG: 16S rRNA pseudouridine(516) synthase [Pseudomonadota bacterium]|nr:16S rRNA pseudouridine(516) synthase [Pseudomonadota bacterium]
MRLDHLLFTQGFGTRRVCAGLIEQGLVRLGGQVCTDPATEVDTGGEGLAFGVQGQDWLYQPRAYLMLHKPVGHECSQKPGAWPSVYTLLPAPLRQRPPATKSSAKVMGVQAVGRLDQDTTGLLLLSDDGAFIHRMNSPRRHVPKVYEVRTARPLDAQQTQRLLQGVVLRDDPAPVRAAACEIVAAHQLRLTLTEGKYHQVKRMLAAVGNHVEALHRLRIGALALPDDLAPGQWRWLSQADLLALNEG